MGDSEDYRDPNEPGEVEHTEDMLTEIDHEEGEDVTPIQVRRAPTPPPRPQPAAETPEAGTFIASLRERFAAFFIDMVFLFYLYWLYCAAYGRVFLGSFDATIPFKGWHALALHGSFLVVCFLYYFVLEGIFLATVGKFLCWMTVRRRNGEPATLTGTFIRNLLRPIDYILIIPVVFLMEQSHYHQRLGDLMGGTTVIKKYTKSSAYQVNNENLASSSGRTIAMAIDITLFLIFIVGYVFLWTPKDPFVSRILLLLLPFVMLAYFVVIEMITETSPGKFLFAYKTCHDNGRRLTITGSLIRTIWRIFDTNPIGLLCIYISSRKQRPGDLAAGTVVIKHGRSAKGILALLIALILAFGTIYFGMTNRTNILSPKFRWNFLPNLSVINDLNIIFEPAEHDLAVQSFRFAAGDPNDIRVPATFNPGETVFMVFELAGYKKDDRKVWLQEDLAVRYPDNTIGLRQSNIVDYQQVVKGSGPIEFTNNITLPRNANPGQYEVFITVRDKIKGNEVKSIQRFYVRRPLGMEPEVTPESDDEN